jgi:hypothetical protein
MLGGPTTVQEQAAAPFQEFAGLRVRLEESGVEDAPVFSFVRNDAEGATVEWQGGDGLHERKHARLRLGNRQRVAPKRSAHNHRRLIVDGRQKSREAPDAPAGAAGSHRARPILLVDKMQIQKIGGWLIGRKSVAYN